jgi:HlyD family secretion protein
LDRVSSPERLDSLVEITGPGLWIVLGTILFLAATLVVWSLVGAVPSWVNGKGILVAYGGHVYDSPALAEGTLVERDILPGTAIRQGEVIATLDQPPLAQQIRDAQAQAKALATEVARQRQDIEAVASARHANNVARESALRDSIAAAQQGVQVYSQMLLGQNRLMHGGNTTSERLQQVREQLAGELQTVADDRGKLLEVEAGEIEAGATEARQLADLSHRAVDAQIHADQLALQRSLFGRVVSPVSGRLLEWKAATGQFVRAGTPVASIDSGEKGLRFLLYVPTEEGNRVRAGMAARIELHGLKKEEWGTLIGKVASVSAFPVTVEGMRTVLQNDTLVQAFSADGAPFAAIVKLLPDPAAPTGYAWSGQNGPPVTLASGMTGVARVLVRTQRPLSFVMPFLRKVTGF